MEQIGADVCVVGAGLAGICAALSAAEKGASVVLLHDGPVGGGSSFSGKTWGLGMVVPRSQDDADVESLAASVLDSGLGCANEPVVRQVCRHSREALDWLAGQGAQLRVPSPEHEDDRSYIPCFDHEVRGWRGFEADASRGPLRERLAHSQVRTVRARAVSLLGSRAGVAGVLAVAHGADGTRTGLEVRAGSTVLATGGFAGLFSSSLTLPAARGQGLALALDAGAHAEGLEFLQIMTGARVAGRTVVWNEKVWGVTQLACADGADAFEAAGVSAALAEQARLAHAAHGPFTTERPSRLVEQTVAWAQRHGGCTATARLQALAHEELVADFAAWLQGLGADPAAPVPVRLYAQACNGGVQVGPSGATGVPSLWVVGECAQVFGADRTGGLASVMAVTLGRLAGRQAAEASERPDPTLPLEVLTPQALLGPAEARGVLERLGTLLDQALLGARTADGLDELEHEAARLRTAGTPLRAQGRNAVDWAALERGFAVRSAGRVAQAVAQCARARGRSLGPHWRQDEAR